MRPSTFISLATLLVAASTTLEAQGGRSRDSNRGAPAQASLPPVTMATAKVVKEHANAAAYLLDKRKKLALDDAAAAQLTTLAATIDERNAPAIASYDSLRSKARASRNAGDDGSLDTRSTIALAGSTVADLARQRSADIETALAMIPAEKHEAARALLKDQEDDLLKAAGGRRGGGRP